MQKQLKLIIRVDANVSIGIGHLMRCFALAQRCRNRGSQVTFVTNCESETLNQRLLGEGFQLIDIDQSYPESGDWETTSKVLTKHPDAWVALDGYHFDSDYQRRIKETDHPLLVIDDMAHLDHYYTNILVNQNIYAPNLNYSCDKNIVRLFGCDYALLRQEFLEYRNWKREIPEKAKKILVTLGGGDPNNVTFEVIQTLQQLDVFDLEFRIIVGPANPHLQILNKAAGRSTIDMQILTAVNDMPAMMAWADIAVSAGGSTCLEMAYMGLPAVVMVLAENQKDIAADLDRAGVVISLKQHTEVTVEHLAGTIFRLIEDHELRQKMSWRGRELVDGQGGERVVQKLLADTQDDLGRNSLCA